MSSVTDNINIIKYILLCSLSMTVMRELKPSSRSCSIQQTCSNLQG